MLISVWYLPLTKACIKSRLERVSLGQDNLQIFLKILLFVTKQITEKLKSYDFKHPERIQTKLKHSANSR